jgi:hypothetical protein
MLRQQSQDQHYPASNKNWIIRSHAPANTLTLPLAFTLLTLPTLPTLPTLTLTLLTLLPLALTLTLSRSHCSHLRLR